MKKKIVYTRPDGGISVVHICDPARLPNESDDAFVARIQAKVVPQDATNVHVVNESDLPTDREFRDAWKFNGSFDVDIPKAKEVHIKRIRQKRNEALTALDKETLANLTNKPKFDEIEAKKQALRDIPQKIATDLAKATTVEEIKAIKPL